MAIRTRSDFFRFHTGIVTPKLYPTSRLLSNLTGMAVQRNKAVVGENAFAHEAGIHQHGMLRHRATYEIMRPEDVGFAKSQLVLGKHSGRHAFRQRLEALGFDVDEAELQRVFEEFKRLADSKKEIHDADLEALVEGRAQHTTGPWRIVAFQAVTGTGVQQIASVRLGHEDGREVQEAACGEGPVDAVFRAIGRLTGVQAQVREYRVRSVSAGDEVQGEVSLELDHLGKPYRGRAVGTDVIEASARAYLSVINRIVALSGERAAWRHGPAREASAGPHTAQAT